MEAEILDPNSLPWEWRRDLVLHFMPSSGEEWDKEDAKANTAKTEVWEIANLLQISQLQWLSVLLPSLAYRQS